MSGGGVSLLVAALDLSLVRSIRSAMRAADLAAGGVPGPLGTIQDRHTIHPQTVHEPEPRIEPRKVIHPTPHFLPRPVIHPVERYEILPPVPVRAEQTEHPVHLGAPLPPPWKQPIWETPIPPQPVIKVITLKPDIQNKGSLIDIFC